MDITSTYSAPLGLPNGQTVPARGSVAVKDGQWSEMKDHPVVAAWVESGKLKTGAAAKEEAKTEAKAIDAMSDDELRALLKDKGVKIDGRWTHDTLVEEAKKASKD